MNDVAVTMADEAKIEAARRLVDKLQAKARRRQDELDEAEDELSEAEDALAELEGDDFDDDEDGDDQEVDARDIAAQLAKRTGPQRPIGDRVVRKACPLAEVAAEWPELIVNDVVMYNRTKYLKGKGGDLWVTNGHWMLRVESVDGLDRISHDPAQIVSVGTGSAVRADVPVVTAAGQVLRSFGGDAYTNLECASLVEDLFPGVEWYYGTDDLAPLHAVVDGDVVAVVSQCRIDGTPQVSE